MIVNVEEVEFALAILRGLNELPIREIEWHRGGERLTVSQGTIDDFATTGLANKDFVALGYLERPDTPAWLGRSH